LSDVHRADEAEQTAPKKPDTSFKDILSLGFSALALALSGWSFYSTNIHIEDNAMARIVDEQIYWKDQKQDIEHTYGDIQVGFFNAGNRPAVITGAGYIVYPRADHDAIGFGADVVVAPNTFPMVLPSHDVRVVSLKIPLKNIVDNYEHGTPVIDQNGSGLYEFYIELNFDALDSNGKKHSSTTGLKTKTKVSSSKWDSFGGVGEYNLVPLLK
jgi:hypothetical protein